MATMVYQKDKRSGITYAYQKRVPSSLCSFGMTERWGVGSKRHIKCFLGTSVL